MNNLVKFSRQPLVILSLFIGVSILIYGLAKQSGLVRPGLAENSPVIAAAGDIACDPDSKYFNNAQGTDTYCRMKATSDLLIDKGLTAVLPLGDNQYEYGRFAAYQKSYNPTWGRVKSITYPTIGNHEYYGNSADYFNYFGKIAGDPQKGYYSYNIGNWHLISLNSNCSKIGGCNSNSPQLKWLKEDLAKNKSLCTLAYWHHPRFSSGQHGSDKTYDDFWQVLYAAGVDIVLNGHDHHYERFALQSPQGKPDSQEGIRQFVVGTGGKNLYRIMQLQANSEVSNNETYGVLKLTLHPRSYDWEFVPIAGQTFTDKGSESCR
jgi:hypothetical protein